ncbi:Protein-tyrosine-phosphatase IBR5-like protein [Drosera capensis]
MSGSARKRERENPCVICGHYHKYEEGEVCGICGHRIPVIAEKLVAQVSAFPSEILQEFLYLGSYDNASRSELLKSQGISRILNTVPSCQNLYKNSFIYHCLSDDKSLDFDDAIKFLEESKKEKARVLVHCMSGKNRSPAIVIAYLMKSKGWRLTQSYQWVKEHRPSVELSQAAHQQLQDYEQKLFGLNQSIPTLLQVFPEPSTQPIGFGFQKNDEAPVPVFDTSPTTSTFDRPLFNPHEFTFGSSQPIEKNVAGDIWMEGVYMGPKESSNQNISVTWRGMKFAIEINSGANLKELGDELQKLTDVQPDTMRLIVPQSKTKSSMLLSPFSVEHSNMSIAEVSFPEGKPIKMMGVSEKEVDEVLKGEKENLRIAGFEEEEKRMRMRMLKAPQGPIRLPQGQYIFADFHTLELPGIVLNPPASEALKRMHMLAADPGIVAIMNKHHWRVGIMTELAPVGYVGISPKCILGFNKNHGEEISLRLRTDDLKGFRKYESIKKTLLHELAHMVYSEHDANFHVLNKQLNEEAAALDWTKSRGHTLGNVRPQEQYDIDEFEHESPMFYKLGGTTVGMAVSARAAAAAAAAHQRMVDALSTSEKEPDSDDTISSIHEKSGSANIIVDWVASPEKQGDVQPMPKLEPDPDDCSENHMREEADLRNTSASGVMVPENLSTDHGIISSEPDPDDTEMLDAFVPAVMSDSEVPVGTRGEVINKAEPDPDDSEVPVETRGKVINNVEPDPDDNSEALQENSGQKSDEPDPDDQGLHRIQDPAALLYNRLTKAIEMLQSEVGPSIAREVLQILFKIIRNVIDHPNETKYKRVRKANPTIQRYITHYQAAMEVLFLIGFHEDPVRDEFGKSETYFVLKRNDPGFLWLAKSSLETSIA